MTPRPMISVCLATYNGSRYIRPLMDSVLSQLGSGDEIVVSDDASTDNTIQILQGYRDARIKISVNPHNVGYTRNFEQALSRARGQLLFLCDQDDVWLPSKIEIMAAALQRHDLVMCDLVVCDNALNEVHSSHFELRGVRRGLLHNTLRTRYVGSAMAFRRGMLATLLPFPERSDLCAHDYWITLVAERYFRVALIREALMLYRRHDATATEGGEASPHSLSHKIAKRFYALHHLRRRGRVRPPNQRPVRTALDYPLRRESEDVLAVIVAYHPDERLPALVRSLLQGDLAVLVVDNSPNGAYELLDLCSRLGARTDRVGSNVGIATALNRALKQAPDHGWILTFDQDSILDDHFLNRLLSSSALEAADAAVVAPTVVDSETGTVLQGQVGTGAPVQTSRAITSGALCSVEALRSIGGFSEDLFIDSVDYDLSARLIERGWSIWLDPAVQLKHSIGSWSPRRIGKLSLTLTHHSPDRLYYRYRNFLILLRDPAFRHDRRWVMRTALSLAYGPVKIVGFEGDRRAKVSAMREGMRDGVRGLSGPRP